MRVSQLFMASLVALALLVPSPISAQAQLHHNHGKMQGHIKNKLSKKITKKAAKQSKKRIAVKHGKHHHGHHEHRM